MNDNASWLRASEQLPKQGQMVYYFGKNIGLHIGAFDATVQTKCWYDGPDGEPVYEDIPAHIAAKLNHNKFLNNNDWGVVDTDDAPWWRPYDEERAKSWCPLPPDYPCE